MTKQPSIPIIIPFPRWDNWVADCISACAQLNYPHCEIWLLPDQELPFDLLEEARKLAGNRKLRVLPTGVKTNPSQKRNVALRASQHQWLALIDADAYPHPDWLQNATQEIADDVAIVAGPNVTPPKDPLTRQISGLVMRSPVGFGTGYVRHYPVKRHESHEMPTCNMLIKRLPDLFFREEFDTGEDMIYCSDVHERGFRIIYIPDMLVFHHRRRFPREFARQFFGYGYGKGVLFNQSRDVSRLSHTAPAVFLIYLVFTILPGISRHIPLWWWLPLISYFLLITVESVRHAHTPILALCGLLAFPVAHISYGLGFLLGMFKKREGKIKPISKKTAEE